jgi:hypothetical protein
MAHRTPTYSQVLDLLLAFSYAYLTLSISQLQHLLRGTRQPIHRFAPARSIEACRLHIFLKAGQVLSQFQSRQLASLWERQRAERLTTPDVLSRGSEITPRDPWYFPSSCSAMPPPPQSWCQVSGYISHSTETIGEQAP